MPMIKELFNNYLIFEKKYSAHTFEAYSNDVEQFFVFNAIENDQEFVNSFNQSQIRKFAAHLLNLGLKPRSVRRKVSSLRLLGRLLESRHIISSNPVTTLVLPKGRKKLTPFIKPDEIDRLLGSTSNPSSFEEGRDQVIIMLLYHTGIRVSELVNLTIGSIDFSSHIIKVVGKRNKERIIPFTTELFQSLTNYLAFRTDFNPNNLDYLVLSNSGKKSYSKLIYLSVNKQLSLYSTVHQKSPHVLRHSFASHLLNNGADLNVIKELLGHKTLAATQIYTHTNISKLKDAYKLAHPRA